MGEGERRIGSEDKREAHKRRMRWKAHKRRMRRGHGEEEIAEWVRVGAPPADRANEGIAGNFNSRALRL